MPGEFIQIRRRWSGEDAGLEDYIDEKITVDAYTESEIALGWYYYLEDHLSFPFQAYIRTAYLEHPEMYSLVTVHRMAGTDRCAYRQMWVLGEPSTCSKRLFHFALSDIQQVKAGEQTIEALTNWKYWVRD